MSQRPCPLCKGDHEQPFTPEELDLQHMIRDLANPAERIELMEHLARMFESHFDPSDDAWPEELHQAVDELTEIRLELRRLERRLGRIICRAVDNYLDDHDQDFPPENLPAGRPSGRGPDVN